MENLSPHSAMARAKLVRVTKTGKEVKPPMPTPHESAILRRVARGALLITMIEGKERYTYEDGTEINSGNRKAEPFTSRQLARFIAQHWIVVDPSARGLFGDRPQRYIVPRLVGGGNDGDRSAAAAAADGSATE